MRSDNSYLLSLIVFLVIMGAFVTAGVAQENRIPLVPYPQEVLHGKGCFSTSGSSLSLRLSGIEGNTGRIIFDQLARSFSKKYQTELIHSESRNPTIWIGLTGSDKQLDALAQKRGLKPGPELGNEGYLLKIGEKNIYIIANSQAGAFYGVQSLKQLLRGNPDPLQLPAVTIRDWPSIPFRCVMDDISRGPIPTTHFLKQQIRRYAEMKINNMSFYIEHVVKTEKYPDMAPSNGGISIEEFRELSEYAADYHIELVGNFQSLGHFEKILSLPQFRHLGATDRMLDPLNPASIEFLEDIYSEMAPAFSSPFFTPNCDEAWDLSRGALRGAADSLGPARIYADHVTRIDSVLRKLGKRTIIWGDIVLEHPEILRMIPKDIVMGAWDYSPSDSFAEFIDPLKDAGFDFTIAPGVLNSNRLIPDFRMSTTNIRNFINEGYEKGAIGVYFTVWDDGGAHFFSHDWYGIAYNAEQSWRPNREPLEDFDFRFSRGIYGDPKNLIPTSLHALNHLTDLAPTFEMNSNVFYKTLVPGRGKKVTFDPWAWTDVKGWAAEARRILTAGYTPAYDPDLAFIKFTISQYEFMADARRELLKASEAYSRACGLQRHNHTATLEALREAYDIIGDLKYRFERLTADFLILWDLENREYWRDRALLEFQKHEAAFTDQLSLVAMAMEKFKAGAYLPPPTEVRLDIRRQSGQFFQYWLLTGSFTISSFEEHAPDFLATMGGEAEARPFPGMKFTGASGQEREWIKYDSPKLDEVDFKTIFEPHITAVAYAYCTIDSPQKQQVTALLGSNDGATLYCNGKEVYHLHGKRSLIPDEDEILLNLEEGRNHILIKVEQWKGGWGLAFRLKDVEVRNHKHKYYIR
ncbi:MAG: glycoside hydrolase family 20 zincin-like fold domain-containing protein [Bacteroidota bacterium]